MNKWCIRVTSCRSGVSICVFVFISFTLPTCFNASQSSAKIVLYAAIYLVEIIINTFYPIDVTKVLCELELTIERVKVSTTPDGKVMDLFFVTDTRFVTLDIISLSIMVHHFCLPFLFLVYLLPKFHSRLIASVHL